MDEAIRNLQDLAPGIDSIRAEHVASTEIGSVSVSGVWEFVRGGGGGEKLRVTSHCLKYCASRKCREALCITAAMTVIIIPVNVFSYSEL